MKKKLQQMYADNLRQRLTHSSTTTTPTTAALQAQKALQRERKRAAPKITGCDAALRVEVKDFNKGFYEIRVSRSCAARCRTCSSKFLFFSVLSHTGTGLVGVKFLGATELSLRCTSIEPHEVFRFPAFETLQIFVDKNTRLHVHFYTYDDKEMAEPHPKATNAAPPFRSLPVVVNLRTPMKNGVQMPPGRLAPLRDSVTLDITPGDPPVVGTDEWTFTRRLAEFFKLQESIS